MEALCLPSVHHQAWKQAERQAKIASLPHLYSTPLSASEEEVHALSISELVTQCRLGNIQPDAVMTAYAKRAVLAHKKSNCLSDVMFDEAVTTSSLANRGLEGNSNASFSAECSLLGVPISIKDTIDIIGHDSTIGFSRNVGRKPAVSSSIVCMLLEAGALIHAKTTVPTGLLSLETVSDIYGRTTNPYNSAFTSGASTGGGGALVAHGGTKIEIGTDIAGSVRIPAHFCGIWSLKGSSGRFPAWGNQSSMPGLESIPQVISPMARNLADLLDFTKRLILARPWEYDHTCVPLSWRNVDLQGEGKKLKWGVMWDDGIIPPTPACKRALSMVAIALREEGHNVVDFDPPNVFDGLKVGYQLLFSDGGAQLLNFLQPGENISPPTRSILDLLRLPKFVKKIMSVVRRSSDPLTSQLYEVLHGKTVIEDRSNVTAREIYRHQWHQKWAEEGLDFIITVPFALPALENGTSEQTTLLCAGYTFLFSLLDYAVGSVPVTVVDKTLDDIPSNFINSAEYNSFTSIAKRAWSVYDADKMNGLPLGIQVVGRKLEEEKVLEGMQIIESVLLKHRV
ncbi:hypothetical protein CVT26_012757 [Gymnopilus dilepis]|uniref:Amidase domain-containing protein n=1 Tax=Gymnopilus dilepis TaxID=231916 RepID=A0A409WVG3_9AGAR|nr:hypothetical protein CVT26_012757 [Gymnopilus dilepis]